MSSDSTIPRLLRGELTKSSSGNLGESAIRTKDVFVSCKSCTRSFLEQGLVLPPLMKSPQPLGPEKTLSVLLIRKTLCGHYAPVAQKLSMI